MYLAIKTRLNLFVSTRILGSCVAEPSVLCMQTAKRAIRYWKKPAELAMKMSPGPSNQLNAFVDASYGVDTSLPRRNRTGFLSRVALLWYMQWACCRSSYLWAWRRQNTLRCQKHVKQLHGCEGHYLSSKFPKSPRQLIKIIPALLNGQMRVHPNI